MPSFSKDHDAVLFDLDGVLVDSRVPFARSVNSALTSHGMTPRPEHELVQYLGPPLHQTFCALVDEESLVQPCGDAYRARYREMSASETLVFPGIREILGGLAGQRRAGGVSSQHGARVRNAIRQAERCRR